MSENANPYAAPGTVEPHNRGRLDRSGVGKRLVQIVSISIVGAVLGNAFGNSFAPALRVSGGGNALMLIVPLFWLTVWFVVQLWTMRREKDHETGKSAAPRPGSYPLKTDRQGNARRDRTAL